MELNRKDAQWSFGDLTNPFGVAHEDSVPNQGGPSLLPIHREMKEEKAQINAPHNNPLGKDTSYVIKSKMKSAGY